MKELSRLLAGPFFGLVVVLCVERCVLAQTSYPMITHAVPVAVERGKTAEVTVYGQQSFAGAFGVYVHGQGVIADVVAPVKQTTPESRTTSVKIKVTVSPSAGLGPREFRVATTQGVSTVGQLIITDNPVTLEIAQHATRATAQPVVLGSTLAGTLAAREEVDMYKFTAKAGQQVTAEVVSARLMHKTHDLQQHFDPIVSLFDSMGRELANNDDHFFADSMLSYKFAADGEHFLAIRDVNFAGDQRWSYALHLMDRPYVSAITPIVVAGSGSRRVTAFGFGLTGSEFEVPLPLNVAPGAHTVQLVSGGRRTNPVVVQVSRFPLLADVEPNDVATNATTAKLGLSIHGRIDRPGDVDCFSLPLKRGTLVRFETRARRFGSDLDSMLRLLDPKGSPVATSDDHKRTKDSLLTYTVPADGQYVLEVRDLLNRGGPNFGYLVEVRDDEPDFELVCDDDKASLGAGCAHPWFVRATRTGGFNGPIDVRVEGLPSGVSASRLTIPPSMNQGCLVLSAVKDAARAMSAVRVVGHAEVLGSAGAKRVIERTAQPVSEIYLPGGGRGVFEVDSQLVQISENYDLASVEVHPDRLTIKPGESAALDVTVQRRPNYKGPVTLDVRLRHLGSVYGDPLPPGVRVVERGSKTALGASDSKGRIVLEAAADAKPIADVPICVLGHVSINFVVKTATASRPVLVSVSSPSPTVAAAKK